MAEIRSIYTDKGRISDRRTSDRKTSDRKTTEYIEGAAVRKLQLEEPEGRQERRRSPQTHSAGRTKTQHLGLGYTLFLAGACALTLWVCAGYLQLQADNTARVKNIAALEAQLADLKTENDDEYNRVTTSVDLEEIRDIAVNELGMVYANQDQVVLYDGEGSDYVRQYAEIPEEKSGLKELLGMISR